MKIYNFIKKRKENLKPINKMAQMETLKVVLIRKFMTIFLLTIFIKGEMQ